jgi:hypothetical protein
MSKMFLTHPISSLYLLFLFLLLLLRLLLLLLLLLVVVVVVLQCKPLYGGPKTLSPIHKLEARPLSAIHCCLYNLACYTIIIKLENYLSRMTG